MSSLSDLLNPAPASGPASPRPSTETPNHANGDAAHVVARTTYDAASALTALAHASPPVNAIQAQHSPVTSYTPYPTTLSGGEVPSRRYSDARPGSSYGIVATPVEPSPPLERTEQPISPTLEQYHHGSRSPKEQRRQSLQSRYSPPPRLAPIQALAPLRREEVDQEQPAHRQDTSKPVSAPSFFAGSESRKQSLDEILAPSQMRQEPMMDDPKQPLPTPVDAKASLLQPNSSITGDASVSSPTTHIKLEPSATPQENTPAPAPAPVLDDETLKAVEALKNEHGLRGSAPRKQSSPSVSAIPPEPKPSTSTTRKRPPPKSATKKGTASTIKKPPTKKRKVDPTTADAASPSAATPTSTHLPTAGSATPSSRTSKTPANRARTGTAASSSPAPQHAASSPAGPAAFGSAPGSGSDNDDDDDAGTDDNERYCVCRRPDNHTWMIACDGGCDDWFHGRCVDIAEADGDLIDTYICPNCKAAGRGSTTWKAMCRREGCRQPARVGGRGGGSSGGKKGGRGAAAAATAAGGERSKYCSEDCGMRFFREKLGLDDRDALARGKSRGRERRKSNFTEPAGADEEELGARGGALRVSEVAALVDAVPDLASFRALGEGVLSPPATVVEHDGQQPDDSPDAFLTAAETQALGRIARRKEALRARHALLKERERFIAACKEQHGRVAEREGVDVKNICGYDARLSWGDEQFRAWSEAQKQRRQAQGDGDAVMVNGDGAGAEVEGDGEVCMKKKCTRHSNWKQLVLQDVRFEVADVGDEMRRVDKEERDIRERAMVRWREKVNGGGDSARVEIIEDVEDKGDAMQIETEPAKEENTAIDMAGIAVDGNME